jgi:cell fate regulator YaaT (PSP1 superfamily)
VHRVVVVQLEDERRLTGCSPAELAVHEGDDVIVDHDRILEFGRVLSIESRDEPLPPPHPGQALLVRRATLQDQSRAKENGVVSHMALKTVHRRVEEQRLPIRILHVRYSFDRALLTVTYTAEERVECREVAKTLAADLHTRVDLRQIGVRDAAGQVGGMAACGRRLCCCSWLSRFGVVSVKMAKNQRLSLNPAAISGMCGRLKCCLRYENDLYKQLSEGLPRDGARVRCPEGEGKVEDKDVLAQRIRVRLADGRVLTLVAGDVAVVGEDRARAGQSPEPEEKDDEDPGA